MAQNDNLYGAPTSGLGGTIDYAAQTPDLGGIPADDLGTPQTTSVQTINANQVRHADPVDVATAELIGTMQDMILRPQLEQARMSRLLSGMQQAQAGKTIAEIDRESPWYTKVFEGNDAVAGARIFKTDEAVQTAVRNAELDIVNLRSKSPEEVHGILLGKAKEQMTGDPGTDLQITEAFGRHLPALLDKHTREHVAYVQLEAANSMQRANAVTLDRLEDSFRPVEGELAPAPEAEKQAQRAEWVQSLAPPPGMENNPDWQRRMAANIAAKARVGELHAANLLMTSGWADHYLGGDPKLIAQVERAIEVGDSAVRARYAPQYAVKLAELRTAAHNNAVLNEQRVRAGEAPNTGSELNRRIVELNAQYQQHTGSKASLISGEEQARMLSQHTLSAAEAEERRRREALAQEKQAAKDAADAAKAAATGPTAVKEQQLLVGGRAVARMATSQVALTDKELQAAQVYLTESLAGRPVEDQVGFAKLAEQQNMKIDILDNGIKALVSGADSGGATQFNRLVGVYGKLRAAGESGVISRYFDEKTRAKLNGVLDGLTDVRSEADMQLALAVGHKSVWLAPFTPKAPKPGKTDDGALAGVYTTALGKSTSVAAAPSGWLFGFGKTPVGGQALDTIRRFVDLGADAHEQEVSLVGQINRGELVPVGDLLVHAPGKQGAAVKAALKHADEAHVTPQQWHDDFRETIKDVTKTAGIVSGIKQAVTDDQGNILVSGEDEHGAPRYALIQQADMQRGTVKRMAAAAEARAKIVAVADKRKAAFDSAVADWKKNGKWYLRNGAEPPIPYTTEPKLELFPQ